MTSLRNIEQYFSKPEEIISRTQLIQDENGMWTAEQTSRIYLSTNQIIACKKGMKSLIDDANINKANGQKQAVLDSCTPVHGWCDTAINDQQQATIEQSQIDNPSNLFN